MTPQYSHHKAHSEKSGCCRSIDFIHRVECRERGMKSGSPADAERPLSVSKAVALLPANRPCRLLGQVLSSKIFVTNRGPIYQVVKPQCKNYEVLTF